MKKNTRPRALSGIIALALFAFAAHAQDQLSEPTTEDWKILRTGTFWPMTKQMPPLPYHPFPDLPTFSAGAGRFIYDDTKVDYQALREESAKLAAGQTEQSAPGGNGPEGGGNGPMEANGDEVRLCIEFIDGEMKRISFNTRSSYVYYVEQSTNLVDWTLLKQVITDDTNAVFHSFDQENRFYRVRKGDERLQFPYWSDAIEMRMYFAMATTITGGTIDLELLADGELLYTNSVPVPETQFLLLFDANYGTNDWPYVEGYYVNQWQLTVTVTPPSGGGLDPAEAPAQATIIKKGRRRTRWPWTNVGTTVQQYGVVSDVGPAQADVDSYMELYFLGNFQAADQVDLDDAALQESTQPTPAIHGTNDWTKLRNLLTDTNSLINYFHYFGHGSKALIGAIGAPNSSITVAQLKSSRLTNDPLQYCIIDGCRGAENPDLLESLMFYPRVIPVQTFTERGWIPRFGASWDKTKGVEFIVQGELVFRHFDFWVDFYSHLSVRRPDGLMFHTYHEAYNFAKSPMGQGINPNIDQNAEANGFVPFGCYDCVFDW
ncbi:MAG TPA: hypothetical protein VFT34_08585 [Verrucomicrobiae bacterium]|nr:hypothetical protein [Verrucomicrobiae bacterium]